MKALKALKAFIKPFEAPQRSVKKKFKLISSLRPGLGPEGLNLIELQNSAHIKCLFNFISYLNVLKVFPILPVTHLANHSKLRLCSKKFSGLIYFFQ